MIPYGPPSYCMPGHLSPLSAQEYTVRRSRMSIAHATLASCGTMSSAFFGPGDGDAAHAPDCNLFFPFFAGMAPPAVWCGLCGEVRACVRGGDREVP